MKTFGGVALTIFTIYTISRLCNAQNLGSTKHLSHHKRENTETNDAILFDMPLDHFGNATGTFKNRYWLNASYYEPGGPVFVFDSGEQDAEPLFTYHLQEYHGLSATMRLAERYKGVAILWEHRFYGQSLPFPVNENTTEDQWQYLTTDQALEDVVYFANHFTLPPSTLSGDPSLNFSATDLHPSHTPWIWLGGSYPGARGALLRVRNPSTIYAVWASSAPVHAQIDMAAYYGAAGRSLTRNCSADWVAVTRFVDETLERGTDEQRVEMKRRLLQARARSPEKLNATVSEDTARNTSDVDAASVLIDPLKFYQYYGFEASVLPFCNILETRNFTSAPVESGLAAQFGVASALGAFLTALVQLNYDENPGNAFPSPGNIAWMWQYCSEWGFYKRGDPNNTLSIETSFRSIEWYQEQCNATFPFVSSSPQVEHINQYGGWNMTPSNVFFTNGEFDTWRTMGLASIESNSPHRTPSTAVPRCNESPIFPSFFGITHPNAVHSPDLRVQLTPDANNSNFNTVGFFSPVATEPFYAGLGLFELALDEWLPCFEKEAEGQEIMGQ